MPRTGRGGRRLGQPGKPYPNRSDLRAQKVQATPSTSYGDRARAERAQQAVPLPQAAQPTGVAPAPPPPSAGPLPAPEPPVPGASPFGRPSDRPVEPLTAGLPIGAGPGPSASMAAIDPVTETLRAAYRAFPNEAIGALLEALE